MDTATYAAVFAVIRAVAETSPSRSREEAKFTPFNLSVLWPALNAIAADSAPDAGSRP
jgi:hypothetical protein